MNLNSLSPIDNIGRTVLMFVVHDLVTSKLIGFDYENEVEDEGSVVNIPLGTQKFTATLDYLSASFRLKKEEKDFTYITEQYLEPCGIAMAKEIDTLVVSNMDAQASIRKSVPGAYPAKGNNSPLDTMVVGTSAMAKLLKSGVELNRPSECLDTLEEHQLSSNIWFDQSCPTDLNMIFGPDSARLVCRPLPIIDPTKQSVLTFNGLYLRVTVIKLSGDARVNCEMLVGVAVDPSKVVSIYN